MLLRAGGVLYESAPDGRLTEGGKAEDMTRYLGSIVSCANRGLDWEGFSEHFAFTDQDPAH